MEHGCVGPDVVGGHFIVFGVVEDVVSINGPSASNPLVDRFVLDSLLGELEVQIMLRGVLEVGLLRVDLVFDVDVVGVT